jgi:hypothetical protein
MELLITRNALQVAIKVRNKSAELLPLDNSLIPFDLLFKIGLAHADNQDLTLKSLFSGLPHSEMGMRYHFRRLLLNGWIEVYQSKNDRRSKLVLPAKKLLHQFYILDKEFINLSEFIMPSVEK